VNYLLERLKEAGTYRSLIWTLLSGTVVANYVNEQEVGVVLGALGIVAGIVSAFMREKKAEVTVVNPLTTVVTGPAVVKEEK
jgi:cadmium resistance protein CadD (predicted permease)